MASQELPVLAEDAVLTWQPTIVYRSSPKGSKAPFKLPRAPDTCVSKMFTHILKKNPPPPTSWLPLPSPARQYTKGGVYWPFWKHPEILNPIIGHITFSNLMTSLRSTNPHSNRLRCLSTPIFPKPSPPAVNSFASF